jgi:hypothetical protein
VVWLLAPDCYVADDRLDQQILGSEHFGMANARTAFQGKGADGEKTDMAQVGTWVVAPWVVFESRTEVGIA